MNPANVFGQKLENTDKIINSKRSPTECAFDDYNQNLKIYPEPFNNSRYKDKQKNHRNGVYQIPLVVHIVHEGEPVGVGGNISYEEINNAIKRLNYRWRKVQGTIGDYGGVDMGVEFSLAVKDENGNCTNGVERIDLSSDSSYVNFGIAAPGAGNGLPYYSSLGVSLHSYVQAWDPYYYLNVYVVKEINGGGGFAFSPASHGQYFDGIVIKNSLLVDPSSVTLSHEAAHVFGLSHTFAGFSSGGGCPSADPNLGDFVYDTPAHLKNHGILDCLNNDINSCDPNFAHGNGTHQDHIKNYMNYSLCRNEFTQGQKERSINFLENNRSSYLSSLGLKESENVQVDFIKSNNCTSNTISFYDVSTCIPNTYTNNGYDDITFYWRFENDSGTIINSYVQNPTITFPNSGPFSTQLTIQTPYGSYSEIKQNFVTLSTLNSACVPSTIYNEYNGHGVKKIEIEDVNYQVDSMTFIPYKDLSCSLEASIYEGETHELKVVYASGDYNVSRIKVYVDWDKSGTFELNEELLSDVISTYNTIDSAFVSVNPPAGLDTYQSYRMRVINSEFHYPVVCGSNINLDAIYLSLFLLPLSHLGFEESLNNGSFVNKVYPNPTIGKVSISHSSIIKSIRVIDPTGRIIKDDNYDQHEVDIDLGSYSTGVYTLEI